MTDQQHKQLLKNKERFFLEAVEILEGKVISPFEAKEFGRIEIREGRPCEELVYWRMKPILHFKWRALTGELRVLQIYKTDVPKDKPQDNEPPTPPAQDIQDSPL